MRAAADPRVEDARHRSRPSHASELGVALVAGHHRARSTGPRRRPWPGARPAAPGRSGCPASSARPADPPVAGRAPATPSAGTGVAPGEPGAHVVRRVGDLGDGRRRHRRRARAGSAARRPAPCEPMVGSTPSGSTSGHPAPAGEPGGDRLAQRRRARRSAGSRARPRRRRARPGRPRGSGRPACRPRGRRCPPGGLARSLAYGASESQGKSGSCDHVVAGHVVVLLRRQRRDQRVVLRDQAELGGAARASRGRRRTRRWPCSSPSTARGRRPRSRSPRPGRPARRRRSRRTRRGGCRASAHPRRCSRPDTPRCRPCPSGRRRAGR